MFVPGIKLALCGGMRSGKDTVAEQLVFEQGFTRFAFGDELKRYAHDLFGDTGAKQRELYQWFGQTMRERDPNIWVRKCFEGIAIKEHCARQPFRPVITDLRQPNEYDALRREGFAIVRVHAPVEVRQKRAEAAGDIFRPEDMLHDTESHYNGFDVDYVIVNDGDLSQLEDEVRKMLAYIVSQGGAVDGSR
ncbi:adenylate kinase [Paenibacillus sp. 1P03SA]|uniref:adenylate kinase n=1 Tax=Paenibacillus sp. 1P03SA TaxID=3132294 RepID=UPI00399F2A06